MQALESRNEERTELCFGNGEAENFRIGRGGDRERAEEKVVGGRGMARGVMHFSEEERDEEELATGAEET